MVMAVMIVAILVRVTIALTTLGAATSVMALDVFR